MSNKKRKIEGDILPVPLPKERYLYVSFCEDHGPDGVNHTILSFTDLALGARVHRALRILYEDDQEDMIASTLFELKMPVKDRKYAGDEEEFGLDEKTRRLLDSVGPECVETEELEFFGAIKDGIYFTLVG